MILRPSNAHRWGPCPGSHALQAVFPDDQEGEAAREGTAAHFWVTEAVQGRVHPVGTLAPNGHPLDADMIENGQGFVTECLIAIAEAGPRATWRVEQPLTMHGTIHPDCEGTPDFYLVDPERHRLIVIDYKYGHRDVDPWENEQGLCYIAGVLEAYELDRDDVKGWDVRFIVIQPRNFRAEAVREWKLLGWQAWDKIDALADLADAAATPGALCKTGPHCRDCSAVIGCDAARLMGATAMDVAGASVPALMGDRALSDFLHQAKTALKRLEALTTAFEETALARIRAGANLPRWSIGHGDARETWTVDVATVEILADTFDVELVKRKPLTPNQARQALKLAGVDGSVISSYATTPRGKQKLVAISETTAAKVFGNAS